MAADDTFLERLARVRQGDPQAADDLVRRYEAAVRRAVRLRLVDARLKRVLDSSDICQEVLKSFFTAAEANRYQIGSEQDLLNLLTEMARKKLADAARGLGAVKRGGGRKQVGLDRAPQMPAAVDTPSQEAARKELVGRIRGLLDEEEQRIFELWLEDGLEWSAIAAKLGGTATAESVRQKYNRTRERVRGRLAQQEALAQARRTLTDEERRVLDLREEDGLEWADIASKLGGAATAESARRTYRGARRRVRQQLEQREGGRG
jgi:RNA polymerase sigma-70 factor (ECF subfamily)